MAVEAKRGCGYRKVGGLYMVCDAGGFECGGLPILLEICPTCGAGIKPARGFTWIDARELIRAHHDLHGLRCPCVADGPAACASPCPVAAPDARLGPKEGLLWVGEKFYTKDEFMREAGMLGISRRISAVPNDFKVGETFVFLAHRHVTERPKAPADEDEAILFEDAPEMEPVPGIFMVFRPQRLEMIVTESETLDAEYMQSLKKRGITPFVVPDDDPDHK